MISFTLQQARFNYRVAGICIEDGHVLLNRLEEDPSFWFLPGGRVEMMETAEVALRREILEELGLNGNLEIKRLLWVNENFWISSQGERYHEIGFYYQMAFADDHPYVDKRKPFQGCETTVNLTFQWMPLERLETIPLQPAFLKTGLRNLPASIQHIVEHDY